MATGSGVDHSAGMAMPDKSKDGKKIQLEGVEVKIPKPEDIQGLLSESVSLSDLGRRLESKYPGYHLPDEEFVQRLLGNKKLEHLQKLKEAAGVSDPYMNFLYTDSEGEVVRSERFDEAGAHITMDSNDKSMRKLLPTDTIFLIKGERAPGGTN